MATAHNLNSSFTNRALRPRSHSRWLRYLGHPTRTVKSIRIKRIEEYIKYKLTTQESNFMHEEKLPMFVKYYSNMRHHFIEENTILKCYTLFLHPSID